MLKKSSGRVQARVAYGRGMYKRMKRRHRWPLTVTRFQELLYRAAVAGVLLLLFLGAKWLVLGTGDKINVDAETLAAFRVPYRSIGMLQAYAAKYGHPFGEVFTLFCAENEFFPEKNALYDLSVLEQQYVTDFDKLRKRYDTKSAAPYYHMFNCLFEEIEYFPVLSDTDEDAFSYIYGDSWGVLRNFEGDKQHIGVDILDRENIRGRLTVVSMTGGKVKEAGWRDNLGYFVGIETDNGTYYLYAHLDALAGNIVAGQPVTAGQTLGRMGDSGAGREEGTFQVHLHLAVSPKVDFTKNLFWINPYPLLRYIEEVENPLRI